MQTEEELRPLATTGKAPPKPSFFSTFVAMYRAQGIRGLYAGYVSHRTFYVFIQRQLCRCGITIARSIPSSAIIFLIYDGMSKRFG
jgi:ornithine carrier protein